MLKWVAILFSLSFIFWYFSAQAREQYIQKALLKYIFLILFSCRKLDVIHKDIYFCWLWGECPNIFSVGYIKSLLYFRLRHEPL